MGEFLFPRDLYVNKPSSLNTGSVWVSTDTNRFFVGPMELPVLQNANTFERTITLQTPTSSVNTLGLNITETRTGSTYIPFTQLVNPYGSISTYLYQSNTRGFVNNAYKGVTIYNVVSGAVIKSTSNLEFNSFISSTGSVIKLNSNLVDLYGNKPELADSFLVNISGSIRAYRVYGSRLSDQTDLHLTSPQTGDVLQYNSSSEVWENVSNPANLKLDTHISGSSYNHYGNALLLDTSMFNLNLSSADDTVQKAFNTLNNLVVSGSVVSSSIDWSLVLNKPSSVILLSGINTGDQTIVLSGDISGSGTSSIVTSIGSNKITNTMLSGSISSSKLIGSDISVVGSLISGSIEEGFGNITTPYLTVKQNVNDSFTYLSDELIPNNDFSEGVASWSVAPYTTNWLDYVGGKFIFNASWVNRRQHYLQSSGSVFSCNPGDYLLYELQMSSSSNLFSVSFPVSRLGSQSVIRQGKVIFDSNQITSSILLQGILYCVSSYSGSYRADITPISITTCSVVIDRVSVRKISPPSFSTFTTFINNNEPKLNVYNVLKSRDILQNEEGLNSIKIGMNNNETPSSRYGESGNIFIGNNNFSASVTCPLLSTSNIVIGNEILSNPGVGSPEMGLISNNKSVIIGNYALRNAILPYFWDNNVIIGAEAGSDSSPNGVELVSIGYASCRGSSTYSSTIIGSYAGEFSIGNANTLVGNRAGQYTSASGQTAFGDYALQGHSINKLTGQVNSVYGYFAGRYLAGISSENVAVGNQALYGKFDGTTVSQYNTAIGGRALQNAVTVDSTTAVGYSALTNLAQGNLNVAIGQGAGETAAAAVPLTYCSRSVFIGAWSKPQANSSSNEIVIGFNVTGKGSNTATIGQGLTTTYLSGTVSGSIFNATTSFQLNGTDINTTGTLINVAYKVQDNAFSASQSISGVSGILLNLVPTGTSASENSTINLRSHSSTTTYASQILGGRDGSSYGTMLVFKTNNNLSGNQLAERWRIAPNGYLSNTGVNGTEALDVTGNILSSGMIGAGGTAAISTLQATFGVRSSSTDNTKGIRIRNTAGDRSFLLGVGLSELESKSFFIRDISNGTYPFIIDQTNSRIGIYNTSPSEALDVTGNIKASGTVSGSIFNATTYQVLSTDISSLYQATLVSGTNIKTINGNSLLGSGNIVITGSSGSISNTNPVFYGVVSVTGSISATGSISCNTLYANEVIIGSGTGSLPKSGTLASPPAGLAIGEYWLDTTDSTTYPILRMRAL